MHETRPQTVGLVGAGKVGVVLATALARAGHTVVSVWDPVDVAVQRAHQTLGDFQVARTPADMTDVDLVLLAVPDDALPGLVDTLVTGRANWTGMSVAHVSGRYGRTVLDPLIALGAETFALHPAMAFSGDRDTELERIVGARFAVTAEEDARESAESLVRDMGGIPFAVAEADRILYHAAMAHASNHLVTLIVQATAMLHEVGIEDASTVLRPAVAAALENALHLGFTGATGPIVRGDVGTVGEHLRAIGRHTPDSLASYRVMSDAAAQIARSTGRLTEQAYQQLNHTLEDRPAPSLPDS